MYFSPWFTYSFDCTKSKVSKDNGDNDNYKCLDRPVTPQNSQDRSLNGCWQTAPRCLLNNVPRSSHEIGAKWFFISNEIPTASDGLVG